MTRRRNAIIALLAGAATLIAAPPAAAAPDPTDSFDEPVYLVKGYAPGDDRPRCDSRWRSAISAMHRRGWIGQLVRVGFYAWDTPDTGCDVNLTQGHAPGSRNTSIRDLGKSLAWNIYNVYSSKGKSIDLGRTLDGRSDHPSRARRLPAARARLARARWRGALRRGRRDAGNPTRRDAVLRQRGPLRSPPASARR